MDRITTKTQYLALFPSPTAAIEHEQACLSIASEFRPPSADVVLAGVEPTPDYWQWLADQVGVEPAEGDDLEDDRE